MITSKNCTPVKAIFFVAAKVFMQNFSAAWLQKASASPAKLGSTWKNVQCLFLHLSTWHKGPEVSVLRQRGGWKCSSSFSYFNQSSTTLLITGHSTFDACFQKLKGSKLSWLYCNYSKHGKIVTWLEGQASFKKLSKMSILISWWIF